MKVRVRFFSHLRDLAHAGVVEVEVGDGATVANLLEQLYERFPQLRAHDHSMLIGAGVEFVDRNYKPRADEEIAVMPPVQGG
jgi:molybdopterin converting factor small subunit